jgi:spore photoproduct lyase
MKRHKVEGLDVITNYQDVLTAINNHVTWLKPKVPNQTSDKYWTYDIGCNEDVSLHLKYLKWKEIFDFFKNDDRILGSFATKCVNLKLLEYNANKKIRIRFSLMPQNIASTLEPNTSIIVDRIRAINMFIEAGYEVHINFSPVIIYPTWLDDYRELFQQVNYFVNNNYKNEVKAEVIFLTHNETKHYYNLTHDIKGEELLWKPELQENKISQYGGNNIRYNHLIKRQFINQFIDLHDRIIKWNTIRYIF